MLCMFNVKRSVWTLGCAEYTFDFHGFGQCLLTIHVSVKCPSLIMSLIHGLVDYNVFHQPVSLASLIVVFD